MNIPPIINTAKLAEEAGFTYSQLYFRKNGHTKGELELTARTRIVNAIVNQLKPFFRDLGFELTLKQKG